MPWVHGKSLVRKKRWERKLVESSIRWSAHQQYLITSIFSKGNEVQYFTFRFNFKVQCPSYQLEFLPKSWLQTCVPSPAVRKIHSCPRCSINPEFFSLFSTSEPGFANANCNKTPNSSFNDERSVANGIFLCFTVKLFCFYPPKNALQWGWNHGT